jgi:hypothetical protein
MEWHLQVLGVMRGIAVSAAFFPWFSRVSGTRGNDRLNSPSWNERDTISNN